MKLLIWLVLYIKFNDTRAIEQIQLTEYDLKF